MSYKLLEPQKYNEEDQHLTGLRNSTDCPIRTVKESLEEYQDLYYEFHPGIGRIGHDKELDYIIKNYYTYNNSIEFNQHKILLLNNDPQQKRIVTQYEVSWGLNNEYTTHIDLVNHDTKEVVEIKSYTEKNGKDFKHNPDSTHIRQVYRQYALLKLSGKDSKLLSYKWQIGYIGKTYDNVSTHTLSIDEDILAETIVEIENILRLNEASKHDPTILEDHNRVLEEHDLECRCSQCYDLRVIAPDHYKDLMSSYADLKPEYDIIEAKRKKLVESKKDLKERIDIIREKILSKLLTEDDPKQRLCSHGYCYSLTKNNTLSIRADKKDTREEPTVDSAVSSSGFGEDCLEEVM